MINQSDRCSLSCGYQLGLINKHTIAKKNTATHSNYKVSWMADKYCKHGRSFMIGGREGEGKERERERERDHLLPSPCVIVIHQVIFLTVLQLPSSVAVNQLRHIRRLSGYFEKAMSQKLMGSGSLKEGKKNKLK